MATLRGTAERSRRLSNTDDHLKNHGLLLTPSGGWALSPAFDVNPSPRRQRRLTTGISELSDFEPSVEAWVEAAPFFEVDEDEARQTAASMAATIAARWRDLLLGSGVTEKQCDEYAAAFEHDGSRAARRMGQRQARGRESGNLPG